MVKVVANEFVREECFDKFIETAKILVEKTNANDPGCIKYELFRDKNDPAHFAMIEEWESQEDLDNHMKASHFLELVPKLGECLAKPTVVSLFDPAF